MACKTYTLTGGDFMCDVSMGGLKAIYVANYDDVSAVTYDSAVASAQTQITAITMAGAAKFVKYTFKRNTASFTSNLQVSPENGTNFWQTDITMQFSRMETAKRLEIKALSLNDLVVIAEDLNGHMWYFGITMPVQAASGDATSGTNMTDRNGYSIGLQANELDAPIEFVGTVPLTASNG